MKDRKTKDEKIACRLKTSIGGQALLEGIMMRGPKRTAMAVRNQKGEIVTEEWDTVTTKPKKIWTLPLFRGMYAMYSSLKVGYKALMRSAVLSGLEELEEEAEKEKKLKKLNKQRKKEGLPPLERLPGDESAEELEETVENTIETAAETVETVEETVENCEETAEEATAVGEEALETAEENEKASVEEPAEEIKEEKAAKKSEKEASEKKGSTEALVTGAALIGTVLGVGLAILLFIFLPTQLYTWTLGRVVEPSAMAAYPKMLIQSLFEGLVRIAVFVGYMFAVSLIKDIRRTFMYHGAEHKTIFCYEAGLPLTVENVRVQRRFHPRCGTSFMIVMLIIGILIGSFIPKFYVGQLLPVATGVQNLINNLLRTVCKLALLPLTVGIGYEFIKYAGKHDNLFVRILSAPGLWMQRISTKEPDDGMIECAIVAVEKVIPADGSDRL